MSDTTTETELDRLMQLANKFPAHPRALISGQTTFDDDQVQPTDRDLRFITRCTDAPLQVKGWLGQDSVWRIGHYLVPSAPEHEQLTEDIAAGEETLIIVDGLGETMIRDVIPKILANLAPGEAREAFMRRLAQSRFAVGVTFH
jgi:hypothetical protein